MILLDDFRARVIKIRGGKPIPEHIAEYANNLHAAGVRPIDAAPKIAWREHGLHETCEPRHAD